LYKDNNSNYNITCFYESSNKTLFLYRFGLYPKNKNLYISNDTYSYTKTKPTDKENGTTILINSYINEFTPKTPIVW